MSKGVLILALLGFVAVAILAAIPLLRFLRQVCERPLAMFSAQLSRRQIAKYIVPIFCFCGLVQYASTKGDWKDPDTKYTWSYVIDGDEAQVFKSAYPLPIWGLPAVSPDPEGFLEIPETLGGKPVTRIGDEALEGYENMTGVSIPDTVTSIGVYAFAGCSSLMNLEIPPSVSSIDIGAFCDCSGLTSMTIPDSATNIATEAFSGCTSLTNMVVGRRVATIDSDAFYGCDSLQSIRFKGDAPVMDDFPEDLCNAGKCIVYVSRDSTGWGVNIPGVWKGLPIEYYDPSQLDELEESFDGLPMAVLPDGEGGWTVTITNDIDSSDLPIEIPDNLGPVAIDLNGHDLVGGDGKPAVVVVPGVGEGESTQITVVNTGDGSVMQGGEGAPAIEVADGAQDGTIVNVGDGVVVQGGGDGVPAVIGEIGENSGTVVKTAYDMSGACWNYAGAFEYDGKVKTVRVSGLPAGVTVASYAGNTATEPGKYTAHVALAYDEQLYNEPTIPDLKWEIKKTYRLTLKPNSTKYGTASGGGTYAYGSMATLKAKAKSGYVFAGWFTDKACTKPLNPKGYDNRKATVKYAMPSKDTAIYAKFVTKKEAASALKFTSATAKLAKTPAKATAGVAFSLKLGISSASLPTVTASGLPKGLSIGKTTGEITGVGTVPGAYTAKVTVKSAAGNKITQKVKITVNVPSWAKGDFYGLAYPGVESVGSWGTYLKFSVGATGKVSGKVTHKGKAYSFTSAYTSCTAAKATFSPKVKIGKKTFKPGTVTVKPLKVGGLSLVEAANSKGTFSAQKKPELVKKGKTLAKLVGKTFKFTKKAKNSGLTKSKDKLEVKLANGDAVKVTGVVGGNKMAALSWVTLVSGKTTMGGTSVYTLYVAIIDANVNYERTLVITATVSSGDVKATAAFTE